MLMAIIKDSLLSIGHQKLKPLYFYVPIWAKYVNIDKHPATNNVRFLSPGFQKPHSQIYFSVPIWSKYVNIDWHLTIINAHFLSLGLQKPHIHLYFSIPS